VIKAALFDLGDTLIEEQVVFLALLVFNLVRVAQGLS